MCLLCVCVCVLCVLFSCLVCMCVCVCVLSPKQWWHSKLNRRQSTKQCAHTDTHTNLQYTTQVIFERRETFWRNTTHYYTAQSLTSRAFLPLITICCYCDTLYSYYIHSFIYIYIFIYIYMLY